MTQSNKSLRTVVLLLLAFAALAPPAWAQPQDVKDAALASGYDVALWIYQAKEDSNGPKSAAGVKAQTESIQAMLLKKLAEDPSCLNAPGAAEALKQATKITHEAYYAKGVYDDGALKPGHLDGSATKESAWVGQIKEVTCGLLHR